VQAMRLTNVRDIKKPGMTLSKEDIEKQHNC
jgi:hypothetical protein